MKPTKLSVLRELARCVYQGQNVRYSAIEHIPTDDGATTLRYRLNLDRSYAIQSDASVDAWTPNGWITVWQLDYATTHPMNAGTIPGAHSELFGHDETRVFDADIHELREAALAVMGLRNRSAMTRNKGGRAA